MARVLMTTDSVGGVFQHAVDLASGLGRLGFETVLALLGPPMDARQRRLAGEVATIVETSLPLEWLAQDAAELDRASDALAAIARTCGADLVHLNTPGIGTDRFETPVVVASHSCLATWWRSVRGGSMPDDFRWRVRAVTASIEGADAVVCPTRSFAAETARVHARDTRAVHNGRAGGRRKIARSPASFAITVGRLWDEAKDFATLDEAAGLMRTSLLAAGPLEGPNGAHVAARHAFCLGPLDQERVRDALAHRPVFVSAAVYETFGLAVLEAAQAGCALVLADIPTYRELWEGAAIFVPPRDPAAFAHAAERMMADPELRAEAADAALARAARYTVEAMADGTAAIYAELGVVAA